MGKRQRATESLIEVVPLLDPAHLPAVDAAIAAHAQQPGALLPILHEVQARLGWIPAGAIAPIARALVLTRADVHGVVSFYHDFRTSPPPTHVLKLCRAEACQSMGGRALEAHAREVLAGNGDIALEPVYCLGNCGLSPAVMLDGALQGRVTAQRLDALLAACEAESGA